MAKIKSAPMIADNEYPKMLYKEGGVEEIHGGHFNTLSVQDPDEESAALSDGWFLTTDEAREASPVGTPAQAWGAK